MKVVEGTVEEIVEYQQRLAGLVQGDQPEQEGEDVPAGKEPPAARAVAGGLDDAADDEDAFFIRRFVYGRAMNAATARRVLSFLEQVAEKGTVVEVGESERTTDGLTDYLMVRDEGPRRFGAVAYVKPGNSGLTLRLRPEDVADVVDERVKERNVAATQKYAINCPLADDQAVDMAVQLTERALAKVRSAE